MANSLHRAYDLDIIAPSGSTKVMVVTDDEFQFAYATLDAIQADLQSQIGVSGSYASQDKYYATNNGGGQNFKVGDDVWIGDVDISNTMQVSGVQNAATGYIKFGSGSATPTLGYGGSNNHLDLSSVLKLAQLDPLPTGTVGSIAVSGSALYFHNGTTWKAVTLS